MGKGFHNKNFQAKKAIRVLHVFARNYKTRFGGPIFNWKYYFSNWNSPDVEHYILDYPQYQAVEAKEAFNFEYSGVQKKTSRLEKVVWFFHLFSSLMIQKEKYDILHIHVLWWTGLFIGPWAKWNNIPAVYESVLLDEDTPGGIIKENFGKFKVRCLRFYKAILAISEYLAKDYRGSGFSKEQVFMLMNCVHVELFSSSKSTGQKSLLRQKLAIPLDAKVLLFVGSVIERKGVDILIQAFIGASTKRSDLYLLVVGPKNKNENSSIDEGFINELNLLLDKNNLSDRVSFTGLIQDREKLAEIYRSSDIFVFPSRNEGLPNVVLEAMASELPIVVSQLPGLEKVIKHKENGLFVPIGDADALRDSILMLSNDPALARKISYNAHSYVEKNHAFVAWQAQIVEFYKVLHCSVKSL